MDQNKEVPVAGANVFFPGSYAGTFTDEAGKFDIVKIDSSLKELVISYAGYVNDTVKVE
ncbi:MAG: carboxypeptidase-like regulatory domain-containing protein [Chitinophagales bacterium]|nr:carboxypeptidase-like regulatory domain-containing protein [Chitinophagales bacterium]